MPTEEDDCAHRRMKMSTASASAEQQRQAAEPEQPGRVVPGHRPVHHPLHDQRYGDARPRWPASAATSSQANSAAYGRR